MKFLLECSTRYLTSTLLYQRLANKKSLSLFTFQKENPFLFIRGAKEREWCVISWLGISNTREKLSESFFTGGDKLFLSAEIHLRSSIYDKAS